MKTNDLVANDTLPISEVYRAHDFLKQHVCKTPLELCHSLSEKYNAKIYLKREDRQYVRSYKLRGALYKINELNSEERNRGLVCASAGNHAQGFAFACSTMKLSGIVFMPVTTPKQKIDQVIRHGKGSVEIQLMGDTFDEANAAALEYAAKENKVFIHPFDDEKIIAGQATVALEILEQQNENADFVFFPVGGGGLGAGLASVYHLLSPKTKLIACEPSGAASLKLALKNGEPTPLSELNRFVDGASVRKVGAINFALLKDKLFDTITVEEGRICTELLKLYNEEGMVLEPAGVLSIAALDQYKNEIRNKNVVCVVSGGNNDITRMEEMKERSLMHEGLKHYFMISFPQRPGALKHFVNEVLPKGCDIALFEYTRKNAREKGPALIGLELSSKEDLNLLRDSLTNSGFQHEYLNEKPELLRYLI